MFLKSLFSSHDYQHSIQSTEESFHVLLCQMLYASPPLVVHLISSSLLAPFIFTEDSTEPPDGEYEAAQLKE